MRNLTKSEERELLKKYTFNYSKTHYFHGTSEEYVINQINIFGRYQHEQYGQKEGVYIDPMCISTGFDHSKNYAIDRSKVLFKGLTPVVLKIDAKQVNERVRLHPIYGALSLDYLLENEFEMIKIK